MRAVDVALLVLVLGLGLGLGIAIGPTRANAEVDQEFTGPGTTAAVQMDAVFDRAQTFTVGIGGTLASIEATLASGGSTLPGDALLIDVRPTDVAGAPVEDDGAALGVVTVLGSELTNTLDDENPFALDFSSFDIAVQPGDVLAIVARSDVPFGTARAFSWNGRIVEGVGYAGGSAWIRSNTWALQDGGGGAPVDLVFRTHVIAPEPAATATALAASLALFAARRRRRRG